MSDQNMLSKPILVVGAARSGTYLLASTINRNFDVAYVGEVNELWKRYTPASKYDFIPASCAKREVVRKTRAAFAQLCEVRGGRRLLEKTPANTLRLPFVTGVFPDAQIIHIIRDGRDVAVSASRKYRGDHRKVTKFSNGRRDFGQSLRGLVRAGSKKVKHGWHAGVFFSSVPRYWNGALSMLGLRQQAMYGPRFPGFDAYYGTCSLLEMAAIQWRACVTCARNFVASQPAADVCEVRYEDLIRSPDEVLKDVFAFISSEGFPIPERIQHDIIGGGPTWRDVLTQREINSLSVHIEHTLSSLGYERISVGSGDMGCAER